MLTVGRLIPGKGVDKVPEALPQLASEFADLVYVVAGSGPDRVRWAAARGYDDPAGSELFALHLTDVDEACEEVARQLEAYVLAETGS